MEKLRWVVTVFAQDCEVQKSLFPDFANVADELAVEWELALDALNHDIELTEEQGMAFKKLDDYIISISDLDNIQYWDNDALCLSAEWGNIRQLAKLILNSMEWGSESIHKSDAIYINAGRIKNT